MKSVPILDLLAGPDRRSIGRSNEVVGRVLRAPRLLPGLAGGLRVADPLVRMRAADALEKLAHHRPDLLRRHRTAFLEAARCSDQPEVQWHMAQLLPRLSLTGAERSRAVRAIRRYLRSDSRIVQAAALDALVRLAPDTPAGRASTTRLLRLAAGSPFPAVRARARRLASEHRRSRRSTPAMKEGQ